MNIKEFIKIKENKPFWGIEHYDDVDEEPEVLIKRGNDIYTMGYDSPADPDKIEFIEYINPVGWKPADPKAVAAAREFQSDIESSLLMGRGADQ